MRSKETRKVVHTSSPHCAPITIVAIVISSEIESALVCGVGRGVGIPIEYFLKMRRRLRWLLVGPLWLPNAGSKISISTPPFTQRANTWPLPYPHSIYFSESRHWMIRYQFFSSFRIGIHEYLAEWKICWSLLAGNITVWTLPRQDLPWRVRKNMKLESSTVIRVHWCSPL